MSRHIYDARLGKNVAIHHRTILSRVWMGNFSYVACDSSLFNVDVGNYCSIGPHVQIGLARHPSSTFVSTYPAFYSNNNDGCPLSFREDKIFDDSAPKTSIGNDVWIGSNVIIPGGIRIGTGAIVAAGSVVVKDVPPYAVVGGNPAKVIRLRFSDEQIEMLLASEWWNWPIEKLRHHADSFMDVDKFRAIGNS
jgi:acetyltransferase-like isoleucine patch superfamily enzyme